MDRSRLEQFVADLSDHQKQLVRMIGTHPKGISAPDLNKALGFKTNIELGAHLSNISRNAQKHGLKIADLWSRKVQSPGGKKGTWEFQPSLHFRVAATNLWDERMLPSKT
jgi:hypothetical protein